MELTQVRSEEPLLQNAQRSRTSCIHWLSIGSFVLLLGATIILALLHFQIIPTPKKIQDEFQMPEVLQIKSYLESVPQTQAMKGRRAAAHLFGINENGDIKWQDDSTDAFREGSIKLVENSLEIQQDGVYFIYTQVMFTGKNCPKENEFSHKIIKKVDDDDDGADVILLQSSKSVCDPKSHSSWTQPIYQGGLFKLDKGDLISTKTSNVEFLDTFDGQVYFGIFAV